METTKKDLASLPAQEGNKKELLFFDIEVFKCDSLVVFLREDGSIYGKIWNDAENKYRTIIEAVTNHQLIGYNNFNYDDYILTFMMDPRKTQEDIKALNDRIIKAKTKAEKAKIKKELKIDVRINSLDASQQIGVKIPKLKQIEGNLGLSIEESQIPFDIDRPLTDEERRETEHYCKHDVEATIEVYKRRIADYFSVKDSLIDMLPVFDQWKAQRWNTTTISANLLTGGSKAIKWTGLHGLDDLRRQNQYIPAEAWELWEGLKEANITEKGKQVTAHIFDCEVTFGVGGLHGAPADPETFQGVIDADVSSMYPSIITLPSMQALGSYTGKYDEIRKARIACKKTDPVKAKALKLVLNSVYGNFKNTYSALFNPFAGASVCVYGQIAAMDLSAALYEAGYRIVNINTDGVMFLPNPEATRPYDEIFREWEKKFGLKLETETFDRFIQRDVNNYIAISGGTIKAKGGDCNEYEAGQPFKNDDCRIVQIALVDFLAKGISIEKTFAAHMNEPDLWQYVLDVGSFDCVKDSSGNVMNHVNRVFAVKEGTPGITTLKKWNDDSKNGTAFQDAPERMLVWNAALEDLKDFAEIIDTDFYKKLTEKKISAWIQPKKKSTRKSKKAEPVKGQIGIAMPEPVAADPITETTEPAVNEPDPVLEAEEPAEIQQEEDPAQEQLDQEEQDSGITIEERFKALRNRFSDAVRISNREFATLCPVHEADGKGHTPSLHFWISKNKKSICFKCESQGCDHDAIMEKGGFTLEDLGRDSKTESSWKNDFAKKYHCDPNTVTAYKYTDENGVTPFTKVRYYPHGNDGKKEFAWIHPGKNLEILDGKGDLHPDSLLYNLPAFLKAIRAGYPVYYCEGEKDCECLKKYHMTATTAGGTNEWSSSLAHYFKGADLVIFADNDQAGQDSADLVAAAVKNYAYRVRIYTPSKQPKGDITDFLEKGEGTIEEVKATLAQMLKDEEPVRYAPFVERRSTRSGGIDTVIKEGRLAAHIAKTERFYFVSNAGKARTELYLYDGKGYSLSLKPMKAIIGQYIPTEERTENLMTNAGKQVEDMARYWRLDDLETEDSHIILQNGVINTEEPEEDGSFALLPHSPIYAIKTVLKTSYDPEAKCPNFEKYIDDLCRDLEGNVDLEKQKTIQEYCGLMISNQRVMKTKKSLWLNSRNGNTGKSQLLQVLTAILGTDNQTNIAISEMNRGRNKFSMSSIVGKRMIQIPDGSETTIDDADQFKQLLGGDLVTIESKGNDLTTYQFKGGLIAAANGLPRFKNDKGDHIAERMIIIPCLHYLPEEARDTEMITKLLSELPGILNWMLAGLLRFNKQKHFTISKASLEAMEEYKENQDSVYKFAKEFYIITKDPKDKLPCSKFDDAYRQWYKDNTDEREQAFIVKNISDRLAAHGVTKDRGRAQAYNFNGSIYIGIKEFKPKDQTTDGNKGS